ncbi:MAG: hybrid sensor histidine kinase/response regulator [Phycisphaerales bacterium]|nr:MAG: hybrid sensor histidine kinase/response regulator [Phycisphaerales bacterium]
MRTTATTTNKLRKMQEQATVLVIDDERAMRDACCQALSRDGYKTETAEDAETGLQKARQKEPDVVLADLKMPGMGGMELLERIRDIDAHIVSIVITGYATIESAVEAMKRNAYDFLPKPFTPDHLRIVIRRALERRRLSIEREQLQQEKEIMKRNFVTLVSHQLRSPLTSVKQYFGVILGGYAGEVVSKQKQMIEKAGSYVDNLIQIIDDWLEISRIEAGNFAGRFEAIALAPILSDTLRLLKPSAEAKRVTLEMNSRDELPVVEGDPNSLKQAFANLINNGIKYNREGGMVIVSVGEEAHDLVVEVSDTGVGISEDDIPFIFDEFFRVKSKETRGISGTGLGLPIAQRIIEGHNGFIRVASEVDKGSTFSVFLPKTEVKQ